ncbi:MAG: hypothetical protein WC466_04125 [Candidatus Izemoplasmatales bacterium]
MDKRTAREISVKDEFLYNKKINVKIGTVENRNAPETIYINISFWLKPRESAIEKNKKYNRKKTIEESLNKILQKKLISFLKNNKFFLNQKDNIYICSIPENFNVNNNPNFISIELYLHTLNIVSEKKYPLSSKKDTELFIECLQICNFIGREVEKIEKHFYIRKNTKAKQDIYCMA